ncbi:MAG: hypothetical protein JSR82_01580 [Verrucomicrobia bacterium]|nr:hypothetical protein [Verrucomicrobiota bacterium]
MNSRRHALSAALLCAAALSASAQTTINSTNQYAYAANAGWIGMRGDATNGVVIGEYVCSGYAYGANIGWINFGGGTPSNQIQYSNTSATDFGVNRQQDGRLRGFAYGANVGWINFEATGDPKVDLQTGKLTGYAYGANIGWINLGDLTVLVFTDKIKKGVDSDGDGITDAWELQNFGSLAIASAVTDRDGDGISDLQEYLDGTDPNDPNSTLKITSFVKAASNLNITFTSVPSRFYTLEYNANLNPGAFAALGGTILPSGGTTSTTSATDPNAKGFYRIRAAQSALIQP